MNGDIRMSIKEVQGINHPKYAAAWLFVYTCLHGFLDSAVDKSLSDPYFEQLVAFQVSGSLACSRSLYRSRMPMKSPTGKMSLKMWW